MSAVLIWTYALTHNITGSQLSDLLVLINVHCLSNISIYNNIKTFKKYFAELKSPLVKHYYCSFCLMSVSENSEKCPNTFCLRDLKVTGNLAYFIESPFKKQLLDLYKRDDFRKNLKYKKTDQSPNQMALKIFMMETFIKGYLCRDSHYQTHIIYRFLGIQMECLSSKVLLYQYGQCTF